MHPSDWRTEAACAGFPTEWWFPKRDEEISDYTDARRVCSTCPVIAECLEWATAVNEPAGMWGGMTTRERYLEKRRRGNGRRRRCVKCGRTRVVAAFADGAPKCRQCTPPQPGDPVKSYDLKGRPRTVPPDDVMVAAFKARVVNPKKPREYFPSVRELGDLWGVSESAAYSHKRRLKAEGRI
jgi:WhiB family redox-sensing transcriptional regulator